MQKLYPFLPAWGQDLPAWVNVSSCENSATGWRGLRHAGKGSSLKVRPQTSSISTTWEPVKRCKFLSPAPNLPVRNCGVEPPVCGPRLSPCDSDECPEEPIESRVERQSQLGYNTVIISGLDHGDLTVNLLEENISRKLFDISHS